MHVISEAKMMMKGMVHAFHHHHRFELIIIILQKFSAELERSSSMHVISEAKMMMKGMVHARAVAKKGLKNLSRVHVMGAKVVIVRKVRVRI